MVYALVAWDRLAEPSAQFHFVDLAHSFMSGRLDTDTPRQRSSQAKAEDPRGYRAAIKRTESAGGWNDWASLRTLTLKGGQVVRGRFAWPSDKGEKRHLFHTDDGFEMKIVVPTDLERTCGDNGRRLCDERTHYVSFPPFPGIAMMPLAAVFGYDVNDVWVTIAMGGLNAVLLFWFLQLLTARGHGSRTTRDNLWLTFAFAFGTVAFFASVRGEVWFTALIFGVALNLGYMLAALDLRHPMLAGFLLICAVATRVPIAFCVMFFAWQLFMPNNRWAPNRRDEILKKGTLFALPIICGAVLLMLFNEARFGSYLEFGHSYLSGGAADRVRDHGMFSTHYLNLNLRSALITLPRLTSEAPYLQISNHGLGLLFTTPLLWLLLRPATSAPLRSALWLAVICAAVPGLLYQNSGWKQFSYRFALDYMPYIIALIALGGRPLTRKVKGLVVAGVVINLFGAITFGRYASFFYE